MNIAFEQHHFNGSGFATGTPELVEFPALVRTRVHGVCTADYQVPVDVIADRLARGEDVAELAKALGVPAQAVREAAAYVAQREGKI